VQLLPLIAAIVAALLIAAASYRAQLLTRSGAIAAFAVGSLALAAGWRWGAFLILWFISASLLSRAGRVRKAQHTVDVVDKQGARDARQVLANGAVFAGCALASVLWPDVRWPVAAAASLAAAGADTWATEAGTWVRSEAWSVRTLQRVTAGTSGAVTGFGTTAMLVGGGVYALFAGALQLIPAQAWMAVTIGAIVGATADTLIGAWAQERRWCRLCDRSTEQRRHRCGVQTEVVGGVRGLDNDLVNTLATVLGAAVAVLAFRGVHSA